MKASSSWIRGFSLLEVIIGSLLFATIFGGLAATWVLQEHGMRKYRDHNISRFLAEQEMERKIAGGFAQLLNGSTTQTLRVERKIDGVSTFQDFRVTTTVENKNEIKADLTVSVENSGDQKFRFDLRTIVFKTV